MDRGYHHFARLLRDMDSPDHHSADELRVIVSDWVLGHKSFVYEQGKFFCRAVERQAGSVAVSQQIRHGTYPFCRLDIHLAAMALGTHVSTYGRTQIYTTQRQTDLARCEVSFALVRLPVQGRDDRLQLWPIEPISCKFFWLLIPSNIYASRSYPVLFKKNAPCSPQWRGVMYRCYEPLLMQLTTVSFPTLLGCTFVGTC